MFFCAKTIYEPIIWHRISYLRLCGDMKMKQKEERDLERVFELDDGPVYIDANDVLEAVKIDQKESKQFFREAGDAFVQGCHELILHRRKRVNGGLAKHWFVYEYPECKEVRLLTSDQLIDGESYRFVNEKDQPVFSY
jgi:hypothetical protein